MAMTQCEFLSGAPLSDRIREVCSADEVDCAVAFWGQGMRDSLFPRWAEQRVRIVCDISMQATTQRALLELGAPDNLKLTVLDGLHAKLYVSATGAVVTSANASANGVGSVVYQSGRLIEAGLFCPAGSDAYVRAQAEFALLFSRGRQVTNADIGRAPERSRELLPSAHPNDYAGVGLLERLRRFPEAFEGAWISIANGSLDKNLANERVEQANTLHESDVLLNQDHIVAQGREVKSIPRLMLALFHPGNKRRKKSVTGYVDARPFPRSRPDTIFGFPDWRRFTRELGQADLKSRKLSPEEWALIEKLQQQDQWLFSPQEFSAALNRVLALNSQTDKSFAAFPLDRSRE